MNNLIFKKALSVQALLLLVCIANTQAQNLPNKQEVSLRAPVDIKIDGKPNEWSNTFQAYNKATSIFYTLSNDDNNLYLVVHTDDPDILTKITNRGVQLVINTSGEKIDKDAISITYPVFELQYHNKPFIHFSNASGLMPEQRAAMAANPDSMLRLANKRLHDSEKYIRTSGMADVDTLLSVYNDKDIMAREGFEKGMVYTYELAVPLKYLHLALSDTPKKFAYHIILAGISIAGDLGIRISIDANGRSFIDHAEGAATVKNEHMPAVLATTDFWGEYTLAK